VAINGIVHFTKLAWSSLLQGEILRIHEPEWGNRIIPRELNKLWKRCFFNVW